MRCVNWGCQLVIANDSGARWGCRFLEGGFVSGRAGLGVLFSVTGYCGLIWLLRMRLGYRYNEGRGGNSEGLDRE